MKIRITAKGPDSIDDSVQRAIQESTQDLTGLSPEARDEVMDRRAEEIWDAVGRYVKHNEYITIEIDSESGLAIVVPAE